MFRLPPEFCSMLCVFSSCFSNKVFARSKALVVGAILTQGIRTVCGILRTLGLSQIDNWSAYHRVLSRAKWSALSCSKLLLKPLLASQCPSDPLLFVMDETLERRWGLKIQAKGLYRDAIRSSKSHFVKCSGLRWICVCMLCPLKWTKRSWALLFLTVLAPSSRYHEQRGKAHKRISDWARQICLLVYRWVGDRPVRY